MQKFTIHAAKTHLSRLIEAALAGEEVVIAKGSKPLVRLVPIARGGFKLGLLKGQVGTVPDFFEPIGEEDLEAWEGGR
jgi:prevent-host-death family protein